MLSLEKQRSELDHIDHDILSSLARRYRCVEEIAKIKLDQGSMIRDRDREAQVLKKLSAKAKELGLSDLYISRLYCRILDESVKIQENGILDVLNPRSIEPIPSLVGYQGIEDSYSSIAVENFFELRQHLIQGKGYQSFRAVVGDVENGKLQYGVLPIENTISGPINEVYDLLIDSGIHIVGEIYLPVDHCLVAKQDIPLEKLSKIYSHPQALLQCSKFLSDLNGCSAIDYMDTARAAKKISEEEDQSQAAIASEEAASRHGLSVLRKGIGDLPNNKTRFVVISKKPEKIDYRVTMKTTLQLNLNQKQQKLEIIFGIFSQYGIAMKAVHYRPHKSDIDKKVYFIECGPAKNAEVWDSFMGALGASVSYLKNLGHYLDQDSSSSSTLEIVKQDTRKKAPIAVAKSEKLLQEDIVKSQLKKKAYKLVSRISCNRDTILEVGSEKIGGGHQLVIAGPCSVESREQILEIAKEVKNQGGGLLRGGCFKPRTSPYAFQGLGYKGLEYLKEAGERYQLPIVTEVMHPEDIKPVAAVTDMIQIGARNMQNFSLLKEAGKVSCPIMLKRGLMSSIDEWLNAAEYILSQGNQQVLLCERGIRTFETSTRSTLDLSAVPVVKERSHLPIIVDPSHASGTWRYIPKLSLAALAVGADGIMVEVHPRPEEALSDGPQALTFPVFSHMMKDIAQTL